jgi:hypothetical protein
MVLMFLTDISLMSATWVIKKTYDISYYMVYGHQETTEEKLFKTIKLLEEENKKEKEELMEIKEMVKRNNDYHIQLYEEIIKNKSKK